MAPSVRLGTLGEAFRETPVGSDESPVPVMGIRWFIEVTIFLCLVAATVSASITFYNAANKPLPRSSFVGILLISTVGGERLPKGLEVDVQIGQAEPNNLIHDRAGDDDVQIYISGDAIPKTRFEISASMDAMLHDISAYAGLSGSTSNVDLKVDVSDRGDAAALRPQIVQFATPDIKDETVFEVNFRAKMKKAVGAVSGAVVDISLPVMMAAPGFEKFTVDAGRLNPGESATYAAPSLSDASLLVWDVSPEQAIFPRFRIADEQLIRFRENDIFIAGGLLGIAGGALIELLKRLMQVIAYPKLHRSNRIRGLKWYAFEEEALKKRTPKPGQDQVGDKWNNWLERRR